MLNIILEEGKTNLNAKNGQEETPLALALKTALPRTVLFLIDKGAKPEIPDWDGNNGLHLLPRYMEELYYDFIPIRGNGFRRTALLLARAMIEKAKGTNLLTARNNRGQLPVEIAIDYGMGKVAVSIIEQGGIESLTEEERSRLIKKAIDHDMKPVAVLIIEAGGAGNLEIAIDYGMEKVAVSIIEQGGIESLTEEERSQLVKKAIQKDQIEVVRLLRKRNITTESTFHQKKRSFNVFKLCKDLFRKQSTEEQ